MSETQKTIIVTEETARQMEDALYIRREAMERKIKDLQVRRTSINAQLEMLDEDIASAKKIYDTVCKALGDLNRDEDA